MAWAATLREVRAEVQSHLRTFNEKPHTRLSNGNLIHLAQEESAPIEAVFVPDFHTWQTENEFKVQLGSTATLDQHDGKLTREMIVISVILVTMIFLLVLTVVWYSVMQ